MLGVDGEGGRDLMRAVKNFIFDWSGTLVDDLPPVVDATNAVMRHHGKAVYTREEFVSAFELPFTKFYDRVVPGVPIEELEPVFHEAFTTSTAVATVLPHAREFLEWCREQGHRCLVLSSAHPVHLKAQAVEFGLDVYFEEIHAGIRDKRERIHEILASHGMLAEETAFVGDMTHDIETAKHGGVMSIAVLTGYQGAVLLASVEPDVMVQDLAVLRRVMG